MTRPPVLTKADMYRRIEAGEFGNTLPRYYTLDEWEGPGLTGDWIKYDLWGVQSTTKAGDPRAKLDVRRRDVRTHLRETGLLYDGYCISPMVHQVGRVQWEGDVYDHPTEGLIASGNVNPAPGSWRTHMRTPKLWKRSAAFALLRSVLNENSYDDLMVLRDYYPEHVVELTALDAVFGTHPGRNAVIWEVRRY